MKALQKVGLGSALLVSAGAAMADVPAGVSSSITSAGADALVVGGLVIVAIAGLFAIRLMLRVLR